MLVRSELTRLGQLANVRGNGPMNKNAKLGFNITSVRSQFSLNSFRGFHSVPLSSTFGVTNVKATPEFTKKSLSPLLSRKAYFPSNTNTASRGFGFVKMSSQPTTAFGRKKQTSLADNFFQITQQDTTILQFTDLMYYINPAREDKEGVNVVRTIAERVKPNLVVFAGDIIDGRVCKDYKAFRNAIQPLVERQIPWTYIPGKPKHFPRKELLNLFSLPMCASRGATSFTHTLQVGLSQIHLIDTYGEPECPVMSPENMDILSEPQNDWFAQKPAQGQVSLAFYHNSATQKPKLPKGRQETFSYTSGFSCADQDLQGLFTGRDRWNDFVASETEGVWLCYGQVKSGFTQSGRDQTPLKKERWGRVIRYDPSSKLLSTWIENKKGVEHNSIISRRTVAVDPIPLLEE